VVAIAVAILRWLMTGRAAYRASPWAARMAGSPVAARPSHGGERGGGRARPGGAGRAEPAAGTTPTRRRPAGTAPARTSRAGTTSAQAGPAAERRTGGAERSAEPDDHANDDTASIEPVPGHDGSDR
jgi:hypothetical protein